MTRPSSVRATAALLAATLSAGAAGAQAAAQPAAQAAPVAFEHVTVLPMDGGERTLADQTVLVRDGRVAWVGPAAQAQVPAGATRIDGRGKYLIPGLADMHFHLFLPEPAEPNLALLLANGITTIREMSSDCWAVAGQSKGCVEDYRRLQAGIRSGAVAGPDILGLTSTMVMGPTRSKRPAGAAAFVVPVTEADGRAVADWIAGRGVDLIKTQRAFELNSQSIQTADQALQTIGNLRRF